MELLTGFFRYNKEREWGGRVRGVQLNHSRFEAVFDFIVGVGGLIGPTRPLRERTLVFHLPIGGYTGAKEMITPLVEVRYENEVAKSNLLWGFI